ncbi:bifunctional protein-serine/threonine kinase/phosphatase [Hahella sp. HN01]|uniref:bifunctional protein-serine/threonine kinase/phosphatase n=1 Tax=unclassified Hahella TaxID=2624107 RepID=UPI001C1F14FD|nr:bifunctional protein-serine/threonine kinase/phosphatase [Hahella sp. HN01]MBU6951874.1 bifunctional protein-serine/threonine kinase/phosphatase [Hahella sp. HN01]
MIFASDLSLSVDQHSMAGVKPRNEDCIGVRIPDRETLQLKGAVAVIADGVSAAEAGKEASEACVTNFLSDYFCTPDSWSVKNAAQKVLQALNRWLYGQSLRTLNDDKGYVCTLSILVLKSTQAHIFHVGDSRIYLYRQGELEQITTDHTARVDAERTYLARAMGFSPNLDIDYRVMDVQAGDVFLLSTDGLHDFISHNQLRERLRGAAQTTFQGLAADLLQTALQAGSDDNLSCQILRVDSLGLRDADACCRELSRLPFPPPLEVGQSLDGYRVERILHETARSQVYQVTDIETGTRAVMKTPSLNFVDDPAYIERFTMEEWIARRVQNPHVAGLIPCKRARSCLYYLTEFVPGAPLSRWIRDNSRPDIHRVTRILEQIVKGVRALHRKETLHQDIKPDNLLITNEDHVTLVDFGSCRIPGVEEMYLPIARERALGTASYSAPEYVLGTKATTRSELFSVAVIGYEMLTGHLPYGEAYEKAASPTALAKLKYTPAYHHNPMVPVWMDGALKKALQLDPRRRYDSFSEWLQDMTHPNSRLMPDNALPIIERNPLAFWRTLSGILLLTQLATLLWLLHLWR